MTGSKIASTFKDPANPSSNARSRAPVFVMGCHRSGTNLLYDTLLSAGGFAIYRGYLPVYKILIPRFGSLRRRKNREKLLQFWLQSESFRRSGVSGSYVEEQVLNHCETGGDFIKITMDEIARQQCSERWAVYDPDAVLYVRQIKAEIPNALFVHIVRDGRDVALSLQKMEGFRPLPWDRRQLGLTATAVYWSWMVRHGRSEGIEIPADYLEIRYEELVSDPITTVSKLSAFLSQDLNYEHIRQTALGRISEPNSSFADDATGLGTIDRWKQKLTEEQIAGVESIVGDTLTEFGYALSADAGQRTSLARLWMRSFYSMFLESKLILKMRTPLGRFSNLAPLRANGRA